MFNAKRLALARKRRGLTKKALASTVGLTARSISSFESGEATPSDETLSRIARILGFSMDFFVLDEPPEFECTSVSFRALTRMTARDRDVALAAATLGIEFSEWLEKHFELPEPQIPDFGELSAEAAAQAVRGEWGLGVLAIPNMVHLLESKGTLVFSLSEVRDSVDAFSFWNGERPAIFLNTTKSAERGRFDCAHELGHLVLHQRGAPNGREAEAEANSFAGAFLMPSAAVLATASQAVTLQKLLTEKQPWGVSAMAYAHRLHSVGMLSDWSYRMVCQRMAGLGYRTDEPNSRSHETSLLLRKVFEHLKNSGLTKLDVAKDLCVSIQDLETIIFGLVLTAVRPKHSVLTS